MKGGGRRGEERRGEERKERGKRKTKGNLQITNDWGANVVKPGDIRGRFRAGTDTSERFPAWAPPLSCSPATAPTNICF